MSHLTNTSPNPVSFICDTTVFPLLIKWKTTKNSIWRMEKINFWPDKNLRYSLIDQALLFCPAGHHHNYVSVPFKKHFKHCYTMLLLCKWKLNNLQQVMIITLWKQVSEPEKKQKYQQKLSESFIIWLKHDSLLWHAFNFPFMS